MTIPLYRFEVSSTSRLIAVCGADSSDWELIAARAREWHKPLSTRWNVPFSRNWWITVWCYCSLLAVTKEIRHTFELVLFPHTRRFTMFSFNLNLLVPGWMQTSNNFISHQILTKNPTVNDFIFLVAAIVQFFRSYNHFH